MGMLCGAEPAVEETAEVVIVMENAPTPLIPKARSWSPSETSEGFNAKCQTVQFEMERGWTWSFSWDQHHEY